MGETVRGLSFLSGPAVILSLVGLFLFPACRGQEITSETEKPEAGAVALPASGSPLPSGRAVSRSSLSFSGAPAAGILRGGFLDPEEGVPGRWTSKEAFVVLQVPGAVDKTQGTSFIRVRGMNYRKDPYSIYLRLDGEEVGKLENPQKDVPFVLFSKPVKLDPGAMVRVEIEVEPLYHPAEQGGTDERSLGANIEEIGIVSARSRAALSFSMPSQYLEVPIEGMYAAETGMKGRWTGPKMKIVLQRPPGEDPEFSLILHGINYRPDPYELRLKVGGEVVGTLKNPVPGEPFVVVAPCNIPAASRLVDVSLVADPIFQPSKHGSTDRRLLGAFLQDLELKRAEYSGCVDFTKPGFELEVLRGIYPEEEGLEGIGRWIEGDAALKLSVPSGKRVFNSLILEGTNYRIDKFLLSAFVDHELVYSFQPPGGKFSIRTPMSVHLKPGSTVEMELKVQPPFKSEEKGGRSRLLGVVIGKVCIE